MNAERKTEKMYCPYRYENREAAKAAGYMRFLTEAYFRMHETKVSAHFPDKEVHLDDVAYFKNGSEMDFMFIVTAGDKQYLVDSSFNVVSRGYAEIMQLFDKTPCIPGFLVCETGEYSVPSSIGMLGYNEVFGVIDIHGKEIIPVKYMNIRPINVRKHIEYSDEPGRGIDNRIHYALFLECSILGDHDVYTTDAQPVFMNTLGCRILEEHNSYQYDHSEGYMCSETTVTERISIAVDIPGRENEYGEYMPTYYAGWYIYDVKYDHPWAEIIYKGPETEWTELAASDVMNGPEGDLIPLISRINTDALSDDYKFDKDQIIRLLRQLAADKRIYDHVDPDDIHYRWHYLADKLAEGTIKRKKRRRQRRMQTDAPVNAEPDIFDPDFVFDNSASQEEIDLRKEQLEELRNEIESILG